MIPKAMVAPCRAALDRFHWLVMVILTLPTAAALFAMVDADWPMAAAVVGLAAGLAAGLAGWLASRPVRQLQSSTAALADGDIHVILPFQERPDGLGKLARDLEALRQSAIQADALGAEVQADKEAADFQNAALETFSQRFESRVRQVIGDVAAASAHLAEAATALSGEVEGSRDRSSGVADSASSMADEFNRVAAASRQLADGARHANGYLTRATSSVGQASSRFEAMLASMSRLAGLADQVGEFVALVNRIAGQTNLLALNANIEAARAGNLGLGFGVVANEVKSLATQTATATHDIEDRLGAIQSAVQMTVAEAQSVTSVMHDSAAQATDAASLVEQQTAATDDIDSSMRRSLEHAREVSSHATEVAHRLSGMQEVAERMQLAVAGLKSQSEALDAHVGQFLADMSGGGVRVGILHSLSGTMRMSERPLKDALLMLIRERNRTHGGVLGQPLVPVIANTRSDWALYAQHARTMIQQSGVSAIFGCWTSSSRKAVLPIVEQEQTLLFYPTQYEGQEESPFVYYAGATPNQQALPGIDYLMSAVGGGHRRFYLVGTDYIYPQITNRILMAYLQERGVARRDIHLALTPFSHADWGPVIRDIRRFAGGQKTAIVSTINGDANVYFFRELAAQGMTPDSAPVLSFSIGESEMATIGADYLTGHLTAWNYFMTVPSRENTQMLRQWRDYAGDPAAVLNDPFEAHYLAFSLWCEAVERVGSLQATAVKRALDGAGMTGLTGKRVFFDQRNHHLHRPSFVGRFERSGQIKVIWQSAGPVAPEPWSPYVADPPCAA